MTAVEALYREVYELRVRVARLEGQAEACRCCKCDETAATSAVGNVKGFGREVEAILREVAAGEGLEHTDLQVSRELPPHVAARVGRAKRKAIRMLNRYTPLSHREIGSVLGGLNRSTVQRIAATQDEDERKSA